MAADATRQVRTTVLSVMRGIACGGRCAVCALDQLWHEASTWRME